MINRGLWKKVCKKASRDSSRLKAALYKHWKSTSRHSRRVTFDIGWRRLSCQKGIQREKKGKSPFCKKQITPEQCGSCLLRSLQWWYHDPCIGQWEEMQSVQVLLHYHLHRIEEQYHLQSCEISQKAIYHDVCEFELLMLFSLVRMTYRFFWKQWTDYIEKGENASIEDIFPR